LGGRKGPSFQEGHLEQPHGGGFDNREPDGVGEMADGNKRPTFYPETMLKEGVGCKELRKKGLRSATTVVNDRKWLKKRQRGTKQGNRLGTKGENYKGTAKGAP